MSTNTKIAYWLHDRAAEMIDGDDDAFPDALRALVKRLLLEEKALAGRKPVAGWVNRSDKLRTLRTPIGEAWAFADGTWTHDADTVGLCHAASLEAAQLAAEDALRAIADQTNGALRGGQT